MAVPMDPPQGHAGPTTAPSPAPSGPQPSPSSSTAPNKPGDLWDQSAQDLQNLVLPGSGKNTGLTKVEAGQSLIFQGRKISMTDLFDIFWKFSEQRMRGEAFLLYKAGYLADANAPFDEVWQAYQRVGLIAANKYSAFGGVNSPSFENILTGSTALNWNSSTSKDKPKQTQQTQTSVNLSSPTEAAATLRDVLKSKLGRKPTPAEEASFLSALNAAQRQSPTVTSNTYNNVSDTQANSFGTTSGGVNPSTVAEDFVNKDPAMKKEYGAYQMATTYMDALTAAIESPVNL